MAISAEIEALQDTLLLMLRVIREAGPVGIPTGHFYAQIMQYMNVGVYQQMIDLLVESGKVKIDNHVLTAVWHGPYIQR